MYTYPKKGSENKRFEPREKQFEKPLGKGVYGTVYEKDGKAVKRFVYLDCFIAECCIGIATRGFECVIQLSSFDVDRREITYPLYDCNLSEWLKPQISKSVGKVARKDIDPTSLLIMRKILIGCTNIHETGYVHCDLKPQNILLRKKKTKDKNGVVKEKLQVAVGDLGLVSAENYSKTDYCNRRYRDNRRTKDSKHDIYSLGIIFLELVTLTSITTAQIEDSAKLYSIINAIQDTKIKNVIKKMVGHIDTRPTTRSILKEIWDSDYRPPITIRRNYTVYVNAEIDDLAIAHCRNIATKYYVPRSNRFIRSTPYYCASRSIEEHRIKDISEASLYIFSSLYKIPDNINRVHYKIVEIVREHGRRTKYEILPDENVMKEIKNLLSCRTYVKMAIVA